MCVRQSVIDAAAHRGGLKLQPFVAVDPAWTDYRKIESNVFVAPEFPALWRFFSFFLGGMFHDAPVKLNPVEAADLSGSEPWRISQYINHKSELVQLDAAH